MKSRKMRYVSHAARTGGTGIAYTVQSENQKVRDRLGVRGVAGRIMSKQIKISKALTMVL
jgi:hypothetical protein